MQNFGRENFDDSTCIRQIRQTFPPSKFYAIWYAHGLVEKRRSTFLLFGENQSGVEKSRVEDDSITS